MSDPDTNRPTFAWAAATHVGAVREHNEDAHYAASNVCVVADGMGGHAAGEVASQLVTEMVASTFEAGDVRLLDLPAIVSALNSAVVHEGTDNNTPGMGTTLVGVAVASHDGAASAVVFHVGDSRCYRLHQGVLVQATSDHSHVQELVDGGHITAEEALEHPLRNVITRALGADDDAAADYLVLDDDDCRLLLCSDGLTNEVDDDLIWDLLTTHRNPSEAVDALLRAALAGRARDNITALVVDVSFPATTTSHRRPGSVAPLAAGVADATAETAADASADATAEITADPFHLDVTGDSAGGMTPDEPQGVADDVPIGDDRTPTAPDAAAWGSTHEPGRLDPAPETDQETTDAPREHD